MCNVDQLEEFIGVFMHHVRSSAFKSFHLPNATPKQKIEKLLCTLFPSSSPFAIDFDNCLPPEDIIPEEVEIVFRSLNSSKTPGLDYIDYNIWKITYSIAIRM
ncbi:hypothetical protein TNIN_463371 [Trichonephila inaurata madagascariensis]|uniref:Uncharacterized protein n=1 Tax=Trichonephila inaurata madagascariensis TaxID=2747483 RepID=A0A8X6YIF7_9ARAC|nr:hypothetical protein TNIN_463371 [Trichonephila inaurata madagascariensis]